MAKQSKTTVVPRLRFPEFRDAEGWSRTTLGLEAKFHKGRGVSKAEIDPRGARLCIRYGELYTRYGEVIVGVYSRTNVTESDLFLSLENDVILPASGETKGDIAKASCVMLSGVALGGDLNVIRSVHNGAFLSYYLNGALRREIAKIAQGDTVVHLYPSQLDGISIAFPQSTEQQQIADCLMSLDEVIAAQGRKVAALKTYKRGLIQQLFPREGETVPCLRFPEFCEAPEWQEKRLDDLAKRGTGHTPNKAVAENYYGEIKWISLADSSRLDKGLISDTAVEISERGIANSSAVLHPAGTVVLSRDAGVGKSGIMGLSMAVSQHFITWTCHARRLSNWFLYYILQQLKPRV